MTPQRWFLLEGGREHVVEIDDSGWGRRLVWRVDGAEVVSRKSGEDRVRLVPADSTSGGGDLGAVGLRFGAFGPARRVTWYAGDGELDPAGAALVGVGGRDFTAEAGSKAARREAWIRAHPRLYTARQTAAAAAGIAASLLAAWLVSRLALSIDLPDLPWPDLPWPDLPAIPWPDLPDIPWPDWHLPEIPWPGWVREAAEHAKLVGPVVLAFVLARGEIRRRRSQDARRAEQQRPEAGNDEVA